MTTEAAFLAAIIENSQDDSPRLIFADWLEEQGQVERAEFIRIQCRITAPWSEDTWSGECWQCNCRRRGTQHTNGPCRCSREWKELCRRERELSHHGYPQMGWLWAGEILQSIPGAAWIFRRGFIAEITCTAAAFAQYGAEIRRSQPVEKVTLTGNWFLASYRFFPIEVMRSSSLRELVLTPDFSEVVIPIRQWLAEQLPGISVSVRGGERFQEDGMVSRIFGRERGLPPRENRGPSTPIQPTNSPR